MDWDFVFLLMQAVQLDMIKKEKLQITAEDVLVLMLTMDKDDVSLKQLASVLLATQNKDQKLI